MPTSVHTRGGVHCVCLQLSTDGGGGEPPQISGVGWHEPLPDEAVPKSVGAEDVLPDYIPRPMTIKWLR